MRSQMTSIGAGLIASVIAHLMLISVAAIPGRQQTAHGETVTVELVRPEDAPAFEENPAAPGDSPSETPKADTPKPDAQPDFSKLQVSPPVPNPEILQQQAPGQPGRQRPQQQPRQQPQQKQSQQQQFFPPPQPPQQQQQAQRQPQQPSQQQAQPSPAQPQGNAPPQGAAAQPPAAPAPDTQERAAELQTPETLQETGNRLASMLGLPPPNQSGAEAEASKADVGAQAAAAFKEHLKSCWSPPSVPDAQKAYVMIRVALKRDGTLAGPPEMVGGSPTGPLLREAAFQALKGCQPYTMLPAEKYNEWRVLDLTFPLDAGTKG